MNSTSPSGAVWAGVAAVVLPLKTDGLLGIAGVVDPPGIAPEQPKLVTPTAESMRDQKQIAGAAAAGFTGLVRYLAADRWLQLSGWPRRSRASAASTCWRPWQSRSSCVQVSYGRQLHSNLLIRSTGRG